MPLLLKLRGRFRDAVANAAFVHSDTPVVCEKVTLFAAAAAGTVSANELAPWAGVYLMSGELVAGRSVFVR